MSSTATTSQERLFATNKNKINQDEVYPLELLLLADGEYDGGTNLQSTVSIHCTDTYVEPTTEKRKQEHEANVVPKRKKTTAQWHHSDVLSESQSNVSTGTCMKVRSY
jgi:hypothetical protein